jgi:transcriptional regulator of NAD metabolism
VKKRVKKDNLVSREELLELLKRVEARSLKEGDGQIIKAVIEKTFRVRQLHWEGKITSKGRLRRLLEIPRPEKSDD